MECGLWSWNSRRDLGCDTPLLWVLRSDSQTTGVGSLVRDKTAACRLTARRGTHLGSRIHLGKRGPDVVAVPARMSLRSLRVSKQTVGLGPLVFRLLAFTSFQDGTSSDPNSGFLVLSCFKRPQDWQAVWSPKATWNCSPREAVDPATLWEVTIFQISGASTKGHQDQWR